MYKETALDDYLERFSDDPETRPKVKNVENHIKERGAVAVSGGVDDITADTSGLKEISTEKKGLLSGVSVADGMSVAADGMALLDNLKGGQFNTDGSSSGPGKAGGAIMSGAMTGAKFGSTIGKMGGPVGEAIGGVVGGIGGGLVSTFAHKSAMKEWYQNNKEFTANENYLEKNKREKDYGKSQSLESLEALKNLRQKQLGIA